MRGNSRRHLEKGQVKVSEETKGRYGLGRTGDPVQGSSDGLDILSTTSILGRFELVDKVRTGWTGAVDDIHDEQRRNGDRGGYKDEVGRDAVELKDYYATLIGRRSQPGSPFLLPRAAVSLVALSPHIIYLTIPPALSHRRPN